MGLALAFNCCAQEKHTQRCPQFKMTLLMGASIQIAQSDGGSKRLKGGADGAVDGGCGLIV